VQDLIPERLKMLEDAVGAMELAEILAFLSEHRPVAFLRIEQASFLVCHRPKHLLVFGEFPPGSETLVIGKRRIALADVPGRPYAREMLRVRESGVRSAVFMLIQQKQILFE
jgi:hypothetical protein